MITRRPPSRQQRPYSLHTMRTFSMPLSGITASPFDSGAADAAVANSALAPIASEIMILFILAPPGICTTTGISKISSIGMERQACKCQVNLNARQDWALFTKLKADHVGSPFRTVAAVRHKPECAFQSGLGNGAVHGLHRDLTCEVPNPAALSATQRTRSPLRRPS